jgi:hypothetical protein
MFESTSRFLLFDYFRVPYDRIEDATATRDVATLARRGGGPTLSWPTRAAFAAGRHPGAYFMASIPVFGRVVDDGRMRDWTQRSGGSWHRAETLRDSGGAFVTAVWQKNDGSVFLPFDPNELIVNVWTERYRELQQALVTARMSSLARRGYYLMRPLLPRRVQMSLRRSFSRVQSHTPFPSWPIETALHDLYDFLFDRVAPLAGRPIPRIAAWPAGWSWTLVLTHDVEKSAGYRNLHRLRQAELDNAFRSSWNFVPQRDYTVEDSMIEELQGAGFEIGVHGLYHDGRDVSSLATLRRRLPAMRSYAERWQAVGFRSPATLRSPESIALLGFDYDSSYSDSAPFEPQPGGCCTWLPFMIDDVVELPITLVQDHTLFELLGHEDERLWVEKARFLRERGGMALILTHPDYIENRHLLASYARFLDEFADDPSAWKALPRDVSSWWRRRARSSLEEVDGNWRVVGPARDEARVEFG